MCELHCAKSFQGYPTWPCLARPNAVIGIFGCIWPYFGAYLRAQKLPSSGCADLLVRNSETKLWHFLKYLHLWLKEQGGNPPKKLGLPTLDVFPKVCGANGLACTLYKCLLLLNSSCLISFQCTTPGETAKRWVADFPALFFYLLS